MARGRPESCGNSFRAARAQESPSSGTTLVLRGLPGHVTRDDVSNFLDGNDFGGLYDFLYVPLKFQTSQTLGYALVNFVTGAAADFALSVLCQLPLQGAQLEVDRSRAHQNGLAGLIERFMRSPVMEAHRPDAFKPILLRHGRRVPFPSA